MTYRILHRPEISPDGVGLVAGEFRTLADANRELTRLWFSDAQLGAYAITDGARWWHPSHAGAFLADERFAELFARELLAADR